MDWKKLFLYLIENNLLEAVIKKIENNEGFETSSHFFKVIPIKNEIDIEGVEYDFKSQKMYKIQFEDEIVSVGHSFLLDSFKSQQLQQKLLSDMGDEFTFFDFQFMLYLHYSADVSSGFSHFRNSVKEISKSFKRGTANLNGNWIENDYELNKYLKNKIHGFETLFKSVEEIKNYG